MHGLFFSALSKGKMNEITIGKKKGREKRRKRRGEDGGERERERANMVQQ